jgi:hypothetical protein
MTTRSTTRLSLAFITLGACGSPGGGGSGGVPDAGPGAQDTAVANDGAGPGDTAAPGCTAQCGGSVCGPDGCGGFCGSCGAGTSCQGGVCVEGECGAGGVAVSGLFGVADGFSFDRATVSLEHKMDVDAFEDGCVTSVHIELARGFGCILEIEAGEAVAAGGGLRVTHLALSADSQCPGFPDDREGLYDDIGAMTLMLLVPER